MPDDGRSSRVALDVRNLKKYFPVKMGLLSSFLGKERFVHAVDDITFDVHDGEIIGFVGESGCGKTTTGRLLSRLETPTSGGVYFIKDESLLKSISEIEDICSGAECSQEERTRLTSLGKEINVPFSRSDDPKEYVEKVRGEYSITKLEGRKLKQFRKNVQMIFQDPYESLNPRFTVYHTVAEPLIVHRIGETIDEREELVSRALENAELRPASEYLYRYPHELSGGQRQRVSIARAMVIEPRFIVADEPVSMLDVSIRAGVMNLMLNLRERMGIPYMFITHDVAVARYMSDRIAVMYLGKIVELGEADSLVFHPEHPYTRALLSAVPRPDPTEKHGRVAIKGELPSPIDLPQGCRFRPRCIYAKKGVCDVEEPPMKEVSPGHFAQCYFAGELPEEQDILEEERLELEIEDGRIRSPD